MNNFLWSHTHMRKICLLDVGHFLDQNAIKRFTSWGNSFNNTQNPLTFLLSSNNLGKRRTFFFRGKKVFFWVKALKVFFFYYPFLMSERPVKFFCALYITMIRSIVYLSSSLLQCE